MEERKGDEQDEPKCRPSGRALKTEEEDQEAEEVEKEEPEQRNRIGGGVGEPSRAAVGGGVYRSIVMVALGQVM